MAGLKDDDSTDIEKNVKAFAVDMSTVATALMKDAADSKKSKGKADEPPKIVFSLDPNSSTKARTPAEQAKQVAAGRSWVCWGAHMADKARHVIMKVDGKLSFDAKKTYVDSFADFKKAWAKAMKSNNLKNAKGLDGWYDGDSFHLEMADSKIARTDERVAACFEEYVKLSRASGGKLNDKFEKAYGRDLKPYVEKAEKNNK